jgi:hypothetical protein
LLDADGQPIAGAAMVVAGVRVTTGQDGSFAVDDAPAEYDVLCEQPPIGYLFAYEGLTARSIDIRTSQPQTPRNQASITTPPFINAAAIQPLVKLHDGRLVEVMHFPQNEIHYLWTGPASVGATVYALASKRDTATGAQTFVGIASEEITLSAGDKQDWTPTLRPITDADLVHWSVNVTAPSEATSIMSSVLVSFAPDGQSTLLTLANGPGMHTYSVPALDGALWSVGSGGTWRGGAIDMGASAPDPSMTYNLQLSPGFELTSPSDAATDVTTDTPFTWSAPSGAGPVAIDLAGTSNQYISLFTIYAAKQARLPDLSPLGRTLGSAQPYSWRASWSAKFSTVDDLARSGPTPLQAPPAGAGADTAFRSFTTR